MTTGNIPQAGMERCSVTGKLVPSDEIVTIHGQRVCAEGKAILLDRLKAGEAMPGELEKPTALRRFGSIFLDGIIVGLPFFFITMVVVGTSADANVATGALTIISTLASVVYFGAFHARNGQTPGKMAGKIRVVRNADGGTISSGTAFFRAFVYAGPNFLSGIAYFTGSAALVSLTAMLVGAWGLINAVAALVDRSRQRTLHDRIAGTRVVDKQ
jgi:uncharacterized RDD family membrane protein YckC